MVAAPPRQRAEPVAPGAPLPEVVDAPLVLAPTDVSVEVVAEDTELETAGVVAAVEVVSVLVGGVVGGLEAVVVVEPGVALAPELL